MFRDSNGLEVLPPARCRELIERSEIGRLGFMDGDVAAVVPVAYQVIDDHVVIRTSDGSKMAAASAQRAVAFEIDDMDLRRHVGWSVIAHGRLLVVEDEEEIERLERLGLRNWGQTGTHFLKLPLDDISGRALRAGPRHAER